MRKVAIGFLLSSVHARRDPASFLSFRSLATAEIAYAENGEVGTSKKKAPRLKTGNSGSSLQNLRGAEGSLPPQTEDLACVAASKRATFSPRLLATKKAMKLTQIRVLETENLTAYESAAVGKREELASCALATKRATLSACLPATKKATELTQIRVSEAENVTAYESAAVGRREELASCAKASANMHSAQEDLTEIIAKLDLSTYKNGNRWEEVAYKLLDYGISLAHIIVLLKKCKAIRCSRHTVDPTLKHCAQLGMSHEQMGRLFAKWPTILNVTDDRFKCKIEFFESIGIDRHTLGKILNVVVMTITMSLSNLRQKVAFWEDYMKEVNTKAVCRMVVKNPKLLTYSSPRQKLEWLEAQECEKKWLLTRSSFLALSLPLLISKAEVLKCFGISNARKRTWVLLFVSDLSIPTLQARFENLLNAGFSRDQAQDMITKSPNLLTFTDNNVNTKLNYLFNVINASFDTILSSPALWTHNFETRIKYRYETIKRLQSLGVLKRGVSLGYMVCMTNENFNRNFVERFEDVVKQADAFGA